MTDKPKDPPDFARHVSDHLAEQSRRLGREGKTELAMAYAEWAEYVRRAAND